ncbi:MAG: DUF1565 domain-containing protein [Anaerolineaceae bacterium]|nr:DUF1565 domain-containing protein [Anaerolineaceae bacterium]
MKRSWWLCFLALLMVAIAESPAAARQYYVSSTGSDANAGTSAEAAFKTIAKAAALAQAGDAVNIAPGKYVETVEVANSGTAQAPITFRRQGRGEVVLTNPLPEAKSWEKKYVFQVIGKNFIVIEGLTFRDCAAWILLKESHYCTVRNSVFDGVRIYNAMRINSGSFNRVLDCKFLRAVKQTGYLKDLPWAPRPGADYIEIFRDCHNNLVQGCEFGSITHVAVSISPVDPEKFKPTRNIVRRNVFKDPRWKCLWFHAGEHNLFEENLCTGLAANFVQLESGKSIIRRNVFRSYRDSTKGQPNAELRGTIRFQKDGTSHNRIYNNLFTDNERTITNNLFGGRVDDNVFKNNVFYNNAQTIFLGFPDYRTKNRNYFFSNLIVGTAAGQKVITLQRGNHLTLAEAQKQLPELYRGNIEARPLFENAGQGDFRPKKGSPCIDAGAALTVTSAAGKGTEIAVDDPLYFCDGFGQIAPDRIVVGSNAPVKLVEVDYQKKLLTVDRAISWRDKAPVNLAYKGRGPDIGPYEYGARH